MSGINVVEFGSGKCATCAAFTPVWNDVQKMISIPSKAYDIDLEEGRDVLQRDNTAANGIPSIYVYNGDKVLAEGWSFEFSSEERSGRDQFPPPEVIAEKLCVAVRKNGFPCEVNSGLGATPDSTAPGGSGDISRPAPWLYSEEMMVFLFLVGAVCVVYWIYRRCSKKSNAHPYQRVSSNVRRMPNIAYPLEISFGKTISSIM
eukprot:GEMP01034589.1.p1 GENE.GEMP01034589.1~~GEMP01034589.1.p1  ORF type:complete len:203 (+),score=36.34 GEMP01034589.1:245-853(+)